MMKKQYTQEQIDQVRKLYQDGETYEAISGIMGIPAGSIGYMVKPVSCRGRGSRIAKNICESTVPSKEQMGAEAACDVVYVVKTSNMQAMVDRDKITLCDKTGAKISIDRCNLSQLIQLLMGADNIARVL